MAFSPSPNLQAGGPPFVGSPLLLIQYIPCYTPYLVAVTSKPHPEDAPCCGDMDPHNVTQYYLVSV
jgi:hypothetical protein